MAIRIVLADEHALVRAGLAALLEAEPELQVVAQAGDGEETLRLIETLRPDVAVVEVNMPLLGGVEVARRALDAGLQTAVVLLSVEGGTELVRSAGEAGAAGYSAKAAAASELVEAVRAAAAGQLFLGPPGARDGLGDLAGGSTNAEVALTPREKDVLRLIAQGLASKEIADRLGISTRTVEAYRVAIMDKVGVRHIAGLTKYALRHQLATLDE